MCRWLINIFPTNRWLTIGLLAASLPATAAVGVSTVEQLWQRLDQLDGQIAVSDAPAPLLIQRGNLNLEMLEFEDALADFDQALTLDADEAHFGRGMALGRLGRVEEGIAALTTYIARHPESSVAYTKRGVRHLWNGDDASAERDLRKALTLDPDNAEAHDDIGVVYARRQEYARAIDHFTRTISIDPTYLKGFHNLGMAYYLSGRDSLALFAVEQALALNPRERNTLMLKAHILQAMGQLEAAAEVAEEAEFLPASGDWSERVPVK